jgi:hypothetical protein
MTLLPLLVLPLALADAPVAPMLKGLDQVPRLELLGPDRDRLWAEDDQRWRDGLPERFADPRPVALDAALDGVWLELADGSHLWRARVAAPGADHLNFGFAPYEMPVGGRLLIVDPEGHDALSRPLTDRDNKPHGEFWTPVLLSDEALFEVWLPPGTRQDLDLALIQVGVGYKGFGAGDDKSGSCNNDTICPEGDEWRVEIASVAVFGSQGSTWCTGFMVNEYGIGTGCRLLTSPASTLRPQRGLRDPVRTPAPICPRRLS